MKTTTIVLKLVVQHHGQTDENLVHAATDGAQDYLPNYEGIEKVDASVVLIREGEIGEHHAESAPVLRNRETTIEVHRVQLRPGGILHR